MGASRRAAAAGIVRLHRGGWANLTAKNALAAPSLSPRDRAFASALFYGTAERLYTLDYFLKPFLTRPVEKLDVEVRAILETGLYQMLYMNVPPRAAVDESVKLTRTLGKSSASGLVNAVLRRAANSSLEGAVFSSELERVCVSYSVGEAVAKAVMQALPEEYDAFFTASFSRPELCLRVNTLKIQQEDLCQRLEERGAAVQPGQVPGALYANLPGGVAEEPLFESGLYHVQGEASQFACACLGVKPGQKVLDLCAAPGGKSATLAQQMGGGKGLTSCDVRENRLPLIKAAFERLGIEDANLLLNDGVVYNPQLAGMDRVLCDVPCSGLGVLPSKPDIRYNSDASFSSLPPLQLSILKTAARYVAKNGLLVYSTCTIRPEENENIVKEFLAQTIEFEVVRPQSLALPPLKGTREENGMLTILPHLTGQDGFFVATLRKI